MPIEIGEILKDLKQSSPLGRQLEQAVIWERWPEIAGESLYMHARPVSVKEEELRVEVDSSVWMNKFAYRREGIVRRINRMAGKRIVREIFLLLVEELDEPEGKTRS